MCLQPTTNEGVSEVQCDMKFLSRFKRRQTKNKIRKELSKYNSNISKMEFFSVDYSPYKDDLLRNVYSLNPDIICLHWVATFFDYSLLPILSKDFPLVWRLCDMNPISGGCHYDDNCGLIMSGCGSCPQLESSNTEDITSEVWNRKRKYFDLLDKRNFGFLTQSHWMQKILIKHPFSKKYHSRIIHNGVNMDDFKPRCRKTAKECLDIPSSCLSIMFIADNINLKRKGLSLITQAINKISGQNIFFFTIGNGFTEECSTISMSFPTVNDGKLLSLYYNAADLCIVPSTQDNLPNTAIESISCGTPVLGFKTSGLQDIIEEGVSGFFTDEISAKSLEKKLLSLIEEPGKLLAMRAACRKKAMENFNLKNQTTKFLHYLEERVNIFSG